MTSLSFQQSNHTITCGSSLQEIQMIEETSPSCKEDNCEKRRYHIYIPSIICDAGESQQQNIGTIPIVIAAHGFGGDPNSMIVFEEIAETFNFVLIRPEGKTIYYCTLYKHVFLFEVLISKFSFIIHHSLFFY